MLWQIVPYMSTDLEAVLFKVTVNVTEMVKISEIKFQVGCNCNSS